jgi:hypothetical protein
MNETNDERMGLPSASNWRRYELCSGSYQLGLEAKKLGQEAFGSSEAAERGDRIHAYLAGIPDEDGNEIRLNASEAATADFLQERCQAEVIRIFGDSPVKQLTEKRLWLTVKGRRVASGQADRVVYNATTALVQDFKTGWSEPDPAEQNAQLKFLAVLVAMHLPDTIREVIVQIVSGPFGITEARYGLQELGLAYGDIHSTIEAINAPSAPLTPGPDQCRYCPAISICQACRNVAAPLTKCQVSELPDGGQRAAKLLDEVALVRRLCDGIEEFYANKLSADPSYDLPGYAMVPGNVRREVSSWEAAHVRLSEYLDGSDLWGAANYRLLDIEKALGKKLKLKGFKLKEKLAEILSGLIVEKQNAASLKRVKGERKLVSLEVP